MLAEGATARSLDHKLNLYYIEGFTILGNFKTTWKKMFDDFFTFNDSHPPSVDGIQGHTLIP